MKYYSIDEIIEIAQKDSGVLSAAEEVIAREYRDIADLEGADANRIEICVNHELSREIDKTLDRLGEIVYSDESHDAIADALSLVLPRSADLDDEELVEAHVSVFMQKLQHMYPLLMLLRHAVDKEPFEFLSEFLSVWIIWDREHG